MKEWIKGPPQLENCVASGKAPEDGPLPLKIRELALLMDFLSVAIPC